MLTHISPVVANEGQRIDIPDGCVLENRLLSGNLNMIVRALFSSPAAAVTNTINPPLGAVNSTYLYPHFLSRRWTVLYHTS